jgi:hypothetical protein
VYTERVHTHEESVMGGGCGYEEDRMDGRGSAGRRADGIGVILMMLCMTGTGIRGQVE